MRFPCTDNEFPIIFRVDSRAVAAWYAGRYTLIELLPAKRVDTYKCLGTKERYPKSDEHRWSIREPRGIRKIEEVEIEENGDGLDNRPWAR